MNMKRLLAGILATSILSCSAVFAENHIMLISENPIADEAQEAEAYDKIELYGKAEVKEDGLYIIDDYTYPEVKLNVDENTLYIDSLGYKTALEAIENGDSIKVIASQAMTRSLPPQTYASVVIEADEEGGFPFYVEVSKMDTDNSGNTIAMSKDGNYQILFTEETAIEPFATKNIVTIEDIKEGSRLLVSASIMTMSIPAHVPAEKVVILPEATLAETEETKIPVTVILNGKEFNTTEVAALTFQQDGVYYLPVRAICEGAGLQVSWDGELKAITVGTTAMGVTFNIGTNAYTKAKMAHQTLSGAPILVEGTTFVPADFFTEILGAKISSEDGRVNIAF